MTKDYLFKVESLLFYKLKGKIDELRNRRFCTHLGTEPLRLEISLVVGVL